MKRGLYKFFLYFCAKILQVMRTITLGKTNLKVNKNGFDTCHIQHLTEKEAVYLLHKANDNGINFYDMALSDAVSEEKLGAAFADRRKKLIIASKTDATTVEEFWKDLHATLKNLKTDYIDLYQFHNYDYCPRQGDKQGLYDAMKVAKRQGKVRFIGISDQQPVIVQEAIERDCYDTLAYPFNYLSSEDDQKIVEACFKHSMGFICKDTKAGGLIADSALEYAFLNQFDHALPAWEIQSEAELDDYLSYQEREPELSSASWRKIEKERADFLAGKRGEAR